MGRVRTRVEILERVVRLRGSGRIRDGEEDGGLRLRISRVHLFPNEGKREGARRWPLLL